MIFMADRDNNDLTVRHLNGIKDAIFTDPDFPWRKRVFAQSLSIFALNIGVISKVDKCAFKDNAAL